MLDQYHYFEHYFSIKIFNFYKFFFKTWGGLLIKNFVYHNALQPMTWRPGGILVRFFITRIINNYSPKWSCIVQGYSPRREASRSHFVLVGRWIVSAKISGVEQPIKLRENDYPAPEYMLIYTILSLKFKLSNEKTAFVPRDNVIFLRYFTQIHDFAMQREIL
jgi:hypothetical protein